MIALSDSSSVISKARRGLAPRSSSDKVEDPPNTITDTLLNPCTTTKYDVLNCSTGPKKACLG